MTPRYTVVGSSADQRPTASADLGKVRDLFTAESARERDLTLAFLDGILDDSMLEQTAVECHGKLSRRLVFDRAVEANCMFYSRFIDQTLCKLSAVTGGQDHALQPLRPAAFDDGHQVIVHDADTPTVDAEQYQGTRFRVLRANEVTNSTLSAPNRVRAVPSEV